MTLEKNIPPEFGNAFELLEWLNWQRAQGHCPYCLNDRYMKEYSHKIVQEEIIRADRGEIKEIGKVLFAESYCRNHIPGRPDYKMMTPEEWLTTLNLSHTFEQSPYKKQETT